MLLRSTLLVAVLVAQEVMPQCGSGSPATTTNNVQSISVNGGPTNQYLNGVFTSVTVCVPGSTTSCQTIDNVLVDTGSSGLRILSGVLTLSLPPENTSGGSPIVECNQFQDGFTWGPVKVADIKMAGEQANTVPVQVIDETQFPNIPADCSASGPPENTLDTLLANGVLGVGVFRQDCGPGCSIPGSSNPGLYYACPAAGCQVTTVSATQQLQNPVWMFASDNNGILIQLPSVQAGGVASATGTMIFGIGTQGNNGLGSAKVFTTDNVGNFTTIYASQSYSSSFIDSGSNALFFLDSATTGLPLCPDTADFYCPPSTRSLTATQRGANGVSNVVTFPVNNADPELISPNLFVFSDIAGPNAGAFDWGLPFFFGRNVFTGIEGQSSSGGVGPYWAY